MRERVETGKEKRSSTLRETYNKGKKKEILAMY